MSVQPAGIRLTDIKANIVEITNLLDFLEKQGYNKCACERGIMDACEGGITDVCSGR
jgi:hypothetical protein